MMFASLTLALLVAGSPDRQTKEPQLMSHSDQSFKAFQEVCRASFESMVDGPVIIVSHSVNDVQPTRSFVSTYIYKIATSDGGQRGPYKFECRQAEVEKMTIYSEI